MSVTICSLLPWPSCTYCFFPYQTKKAECTAYEVFVKTLITLQFRFLFSQASQPDLKYTEEDCHLNVRLLFTYFLKHTQALYPEREMEFLLFSWSCLHKTYHRVLPNNSRLPLFSDFVRKRYVFSVHVIHFWFGGYRTRYDCSQILISNLS